MTTKKEKIQAIDIELNVVKSIGTAYYRLDKDFKEFLDKVEDKHRIIGFEYEPSSWNFGIILADK